jgi:hypothetical protein
MRACTEARYSHVWVCKNPLICSFVQSEYSKTMGRISWIYLLNILSSRLYSYNMGTKSQLEKVKPKGNLSLCMPLRHKERNYSSLDWDNWLSLQPSSWTPEENAPSTHWIREMQGGSQSHSGCFEVEKKFLAPTCNGTMFARWSNP